MRTKLPKIDGKTLKDWYGWLKAQECGCCHMKVGDTELHEVDICMGWHEYDEEDIVAEPVKIGEIIVPTTKHKPVWKVAWKIGWQSPNNGMQCDLDWDFDMPGPCNEYGDVYDTLSEVGEPKTMKEWNRLAREINKTAKEVYKAAREIDAKEAGPAKEYV